MLGLCVSRCGLSNFLVRSSGGIQYQRMWADKAKGAGKKGKVRLDANQQKIMFYAFHIIINQIQESTNDSLLNRLSDQQNCTIVCSMKSDLMNTFERRPTVGGLLMTSMCILSLIGGSSNIYSNSCSHLGSLFFFTCCTNSSQAHPHKVMSSTKSMHQF